MSSPRTGLFLHDNISIRCNFACKLTELHASLCSCMQAHGSACILEHSACILHVFWIILEHSACILEHSKTFKNILEHSVCLLQHSGLFCMHTLLNCLHAFWNFLYAFWNVLEAYVMACKLIYSFALHLFPLLYCLVLSCTVL